MRIHTNSASALIKAPYHVRFCVATLVIALVHASSIFLVPLFSVQEWYRVTGMDWEKGK